MNENKYTTFNFNKKIIKINYLFKCRKQIIYLNI